MFRLLSRPVEPMVTLTINGAPHTVPAGCSVWTAMTLAGQTETRKSPVTEQPRSAYCAMGVCFECLVEVNGMPNRQACLTPVEEGMVVSHQTITEQTAALPEEAS
ncbi:MULTISPECIES: (2Fe-2S)-binding protein [Neptunomonas]|uniref:(2Fe-2S)-binding protein n=1 Tax=Neptunomonas marina TaxID=1815562 RepID=A0A437Q8A0_9GAMM|nr:MULTISPECIES: (2Fe-2S)-binding protein [Neptunomonas]RVU30709.1 (2Fe-2S)-binding protein [Neptunomonas marina]